MLDGILLDRAFGAGELLPAAEVRPSGAHNLTNALAAAALALAAGADGTAVAAGLRSFQPGGHRNAPVATVGGVNYVDDSKATNPHAAEASLLAYPRVVWIAGGQLKGAERRRPGDPRSRTGSPGWCCSVSTPGLIDAALYRHAPDVPRIAVPGRNDGAMDQAVRAASTLAQPGRCRAARTRRGQRWTCSPPTPLGATRSVSRWPPWRVAAGWAGDAAGVRGGRSPRRSAPRPGPSAAFRAGE